MDRITYGMDRTNIPFARSVITEEEKKEIIACLDSGWLTRGSRTNEFEKLLKKYLGSENVIAVNSGTSALHVSLVALGIKPGDEVITTPMTWPATSNVIIHRGATPVFADINSKTMNINPEEIRRSITDKTKAIIPVHLYGQPCEMDEIIEIAEENDLYVIEDAAHALEAEYKGKKIGTIGATTCFSFYPNKNITTGEGGAISTTNKDLAKKILLYSNSGIDVASWNKHQNYHNVASHRLAVVPGFKYNMSDLQASLGIHQIKKVNIFQKHRAELWKIYDDAFESSTLLDTPEFIDGIKHAKHLYVVQLSLDKLKISRDEFINLLKQHNIGCGIHYISISKHPYYDQEYTINTPIAEKISEEIISLPFSHGHTEEEIKYTADLINRILKEYKS